MSDRDNNQRQKDGPLNRSSGEGTNEQASPLQGRVFHIASTPERTLAQLLTRPPLDEVEPTPAVQARTEAIFNETLTPEQAVQRILADVAAKGDEAVLDYSRRIDGVALTADGLQVTDEEFARARGNVAPDMLAAIRTAVHNVRRYHEAQKTRGWFEQGDERELFGQRVLPLEKVGVYIPGGRAPLISTVIMTVVPARVAGVTDIVVTTPCDREGRVHPAVLVALEEAGAHRVFKIGGAQAIGALAYGTAQVDKVDKIVGPGNLFVTLAKKAVFGRVGIDGLNGPSEVAIVADDSADAAWVAADLIAQAEHDPEAAAWLFTTDAALATAVEQAVEEQMASLPEATAAVVAQSLSRWGGIVVGDDMDGLMEWVNFVAAEHVQLMVARPWNVMPALRFAGAVFLGPYSPVPLGDYVAGPSHVLPTNRTARFASPLGVYDFVRHMSVVSFNEQAFRSVAEDGAVLADAEGLTAHAASLRRRLS